MQKTSTASKPDLDWSQVRETVLMLNLAVTQIEKAMREGDDSTTALAESFTSLAGNMQVIGKAAENLSDSDEKHTITQNYKSVANKVNSAIIAFQFYDKLAQRLSHVCHSLASLANLIAEPNKLYNPYEWHGLQQMIKSKYTINADRAMFDAILNGASVEEALKAAEKYEQKVEANIELF